MSQNSCAHAASRFGAFGRRSAQRARIGPSPGIEQQAADAFSESCDELAHVLADPE
jgi:hypothetical protein